MGDRRRSKGAESTPVMDATAARLSWSNTAPLGRPVVPPVQQMTTGRRGCNDGSGGGGASQKPASCDQPITRPAGGGRSRPSQSTTVRRGRARPVMWPTSSGPNRWLTPLVMAPRRMSAW